MEHILHWLWLKNTLPFSKIKELHKIIGNVDIIYKMRDFSEFSFLDEEDKKNLLKKDLTKENDIYNICVKENIKIIVWDDRERYPKLLRHIFNPPVVLYAKGKIPNWKNIFTLAVVGTRSMTKYGNDITTHLAKELVNQGVTIVTGMARGNDIIATRQAMKKNAFTIALLGGGVDVCYPAENFEEYEYLSKHGLLLSEYPPRTRPNGYHFPERNRIMVGISRAVLVTEAPHKSGALITAHIAAEEGKDVFAVPGNITSSSSVGTNELIQEGAKMVLDVNDILREYPIFAKRQKEKKLQDEINEKKIKNGEKVYSDAENKIMELLLENDYTTDEISEKLDIPIKECGSTCFMLEISGDIERRPGNYYHRVK